MDSPQPCMTVLATRTCFTACPHTSQIWFPRKSPFIAFNDYSPGTRLAARCGKTSPGQGPPPVAAEHGERSLAATVTVGASRKADAGWPGERVGWNRTPHKILRGKEARALLSGSTWSSGAGESVNGTADHRCIPMGRGFGEANRATAKPTDPPSNHQTRGCIAQAPRNEPRPTRQLLSPLSRPTMACPIALPMFM